MVRGNKDESDLVQGTGIALSKTRSMGSMAEGPPGLSLPSVACRGNQPLLVSGKGTICLELGGAEAQRRQKGHLAAWSEKALQRS